MNKPRSDDFVAAAAASRAKAIKEERIDDEDFVAGAPVDDKGLPLES